MACGDLVDVSADRELRPEKQTLCHEGLYDEVLDRPIWSDISSNLETKSQFGERPKKCPPDVSPPGGQPFTKVPAGTLLTLARGVRLLDCNEASPRTRKPVGSRRAFLMGTLDCVKPEHSI
jgi:hypothetical protein